MQPTIHGIPQGIERELIVHNISANYACQNKTARSAADMNAQEPDIITPNRFGLLSTEHDSDKESESNDEIDPSESSTSTIRQSTNNIKDNSKTAEVVAAGSYLANRTQMCSVNGALSGTKLVTCGIPQGSILGPLLFLIYINDLPNSLEYSSTRMFADDTTLTVSGKSIQDVEVAIDHDLTNIKQWLSANRLSLNLVKTEYLLIGSRYNINNLLAAPNEFVGDTPIKKVKETKALGVHIDEFLLFGHIGIEKRAAAALPKEADCGTAVGREKANAKQIFTELINAIQRRSKPYDRVLANNQFGFLYMHGITYGVHYDDPKVSKVMQWTKPLPCKGKSLPGLKKPLPDSSALPIKIIWPAKAETTNFQFARPTPEAIGRPGNIGHSEEQLLNSFNIMADNFIRRHNNECPCYVILGKSWKNIWGDNFQIIGIWVDGHE
ncbi:Hypothetical predicted protein [Paramuricea clavata]|uniref:Uncharacterized protein n=1 Tax=Paramuricea clavata TaxID=317549 RepID=A0A6S7HA04_PARCT|nr:Hypothetical predicted protein [Paramuricea clavata]